MAGPKFAAGKRAIAICDRCGGQYLLKELRTLTIKLKKVNLKVCRDCWEPDHPQLKLGMYPVYDPQALRDPRPDTTYVTSGTYSEGSRVIEWGWNPVGGAQGIDASSAPNALVMQIELGTVTVVTT